MDEKEAERYFVQWLSERGLNQCPKCNSDMTKDSLDIINGETEYGTGYVFAELSCQKCGKELATWSSWWPGADSLADFVENVMDDDLTINQ